ncbi:unnamed protein product [Calypogeia fissa]
MLKGPKDEGLALRKKCEEISKHLSSKGYKEDDLKKPYNIRNRTTGRSIVYPSSKAQLSIQQVDALLGTDLVDYGSISEIDLSSSKYWWVIETQSLSHFKKIKANSANPSSRPSYATSLDAIALFIYKHGFQDLLHVDALMHGHNGAASRTLAHRRKNQEELLKSGVLRILAKLLKRIHESNFYRSPEDKIANALTISIEKRKIDREGLSADWEFYGANYHPKIPLRDKLIYLRVSHAVSRRPTKRPTFLWASIFRKAAPSSSSKNKQQRVTDKRKPTGQPSKASSTLAPSCQPAKRIQCNAVSSTEGTARKCRLKTPTKRNNSNLPLYVPTKESDEGKVKQLQRPSSSYSMHISSKVDIEIPRERPLTSSQTQMAPRASCSHHEKRGNGHGVRGELKRSKFKVRNSADGLPSFLKTSFREYCLKNDSDGGLSALARIEQLCPIPEHREEDFQRRTDLQVEIERLKILRW